MVRTCDQIKWPLQKDRTRHSTREKKKRKAKENNIREWTGIDFNISQIELGVDIATLGVE